MKFDIMPYRRVGPISFGMTRTEVRETLAEIPETFIRDPDDPSPADAFQDLGIHIFYDAEDRCAAVEFWRAQPTFRGHALLYERLTQVVSWLQKMDPRLAQNILGASSPKFGFALYTDGAAKSDTATINGVLVFRRGY